MQAFITRSTKSLCSALIKAVDFRSMVMLFCKYTKQMQSDEATHKANYCFSLFYFDAIGKLQSKSITNKMKVNSK